MDFALIAIMSWLMQQVASNTEFDRTSPVETENAPEGEDVTAFTFAINPDDILGGRYRITVERLNQRDVQEGCLHVASMTAVA